MARVMELYHMADSQRVSFRTSIIISLLSWLAFLLFWSFSFFTSAGWRMLTDASLFAGRSPVLSKALWEAHQAGSGPTPAPAVLALATFFALFGFLVWTLPKAIRHQQSSRPLDRHAPPQPKNFGDVIRIFAWAPFFVETVCGFPVGLALMGDAILYEAWPALAFGSVLVFATSLLVATGLRWPSASTPRS
jgi:hypothetical protein